MASHGPFKSFFDMSKLYNILWLDDQHADKEMLQFIINAESEGIILEGYTSFEEGFYVLEKNLSRFDAILLDGLFFEKESQVAGTEDVSGIGMAIARINELKPRKNFPWFVLSGKSEFTREKNPVLIANKANCFDKTNYKDIESLFEEIKKAADQQPDTQIRHKYQRVFEICCDKYIGSSASNFLLEAIKLLETETAFDVLKSFTLLRDIYEMLFRKLNSIQIIPDDVFKNTGWINNSSKFLSGKHEAYEWCNENPIHPVILHILYNSLSITQDASHATPDKLQYKVKEHVQNLNSTFLYKGALYQLLEVLLWFKNFIDSHPVTEFNKKLWVKKSTTTAAVSGEWIKGKVVKIENGWGTFHSDDGNKRISIIQSLVTEHSIKLNDIIEIITKPSPDGTKQHIDKLRKI